MKILKKITNEILASNYIAIVCHINPDGDTLGSAFALKKALKKIDKKCDVLCDDLLPNKYIFMEDVSVEHEFDTKKYDLIIFVDCAEKSLSGALFEQTDISSINSINIDHHGTNNKYAKINLVDDSYSSTAEIILELIKDMQVEIDKSIAEDIYIGILTDTGRFAYSYTSERTHENAAFLLKCGADFSKLNKQLYGTIPYTKLMLTKQMLINHKMFEDGKIVFSLLSNNDFEVSGAGPQETDSLINTLLAIENVGIAILVRQESGNKFKASFRSSDDIDISKAAKILGGGGHKQAAGATLQCTASEVESIIKSSLEEAELIK